MPKISQFPDGGSAQNTDRIPIVRSGGDYTITGANLATLANYSQAYAGYLTATAGQTVFSLPASPGSLANLFIAVDGATQTPGVDYTWTTPTTLTFAVGLTVGQTVYYRYTSSVPVGTPSAGGTNGQIQYNNSGILNGFTPSGDVSITPTTGVMHVNSVQSSAVVDASLASSSQIYAVNQTYNQTAAEISASVTPTNYGYPPGDVRRYGADPTGTSSNYTAFTNAIAAVGANGVVIVPPGTYLFSSTVSLPNNNLTISAYGATLTTSSTLTNGIFYQTNTGRKFSLYGASFTGASIAYNRYFTSGSITVYKEHDIRDCSFSMNSSIYAIALYKATGGTIENCYFYYGNGVVSSGSVNTRYINCVWVGSLYCINEGNGNMPTGSNPAITGSQGTQIIGGYSLSVNYCYYGNATDATLINNVVWDYAATNNIILISCYNAEISNSYLASNTIAPCIWAIGNYYAKFVNNTLYGIAGLTSDKLMYLTSGCSSCIISGNHFENFYYQGLVYDTCTYLSIINNNFTPYSGAGTYSINSTNDDVTNKIHQNCVKQATGVSVPMNGITTKDIWDNTGYVTENSGNTSSGTGVTSFTVTHGLALTPSINNIQLTLQSTTQAGLIVWVSAVTSTTFTVSASATITSGFTVGWRATIKA